MNTHIFATVIFGLAASLCWGSGDFSSGLASRRAYAGSVVLTGYAVGLVLLVTLALIGKEPVPILRTCCREGWRVWRECSGSSRSTRPSPGQRWA